MDGQPGPGGAGADPASGLPVGAASPGTDPRAPGLAAFAHDGSWSACPPSAALAAALQDASGPECRAPGATRDELLGMLRQWQALESWAAAAKLALLRTLIRDDDQPLPGGGYTEDLPQGWTKSLTHEVALALSMPVVSADNLMWLAWDLQALLPGTGALLAAGKLTLPKARAIDQALNLLTSDNAAKAEAMILPDLPGKTYGQVEKLAVNAALTVDPHAAENRRQDAEQHKSRVQLYREQSGATALSGRDLPTGQTLAAHASVCARAQEYKNSGAFPDATRMDQYRAAAYLDLLNNIPAEARIATGQITTVSTDRNAAGADDVSAAGPEANAPDRGGIAPDDSRPDDEPHPSGCPCDECDAALPPPGGDDYPLANGAPDDERGGPDGTGPQSERPGGNRPAPGRPASPRPASPRLTDLVIPLTTLLGLARRPGEGHGLGPLDPALCRDLATAAIHSPHTTLCVTVTTPDGIAIGHGCARPTRNNPGTPNHTSHPAAAPPLPARLNLTIPAPRLTDPASLTAPTANHQGAPSGHPPWSFTKHNDTGPPGGCGTWTLALPTGRQLTVRLGQVPTFDCDHAHESHAYQPNDTLRHLVQVRDYECTFPTCTRHARETDFEHAVPYHQGGKTCACNAGARSRACHQIKQSPGWTVTQPRPGWHQWTTPSGRTYTQPPKRYPA
jgi:Domain of unknown function (DUF222)